MSDWVNKKISKATLQKMTVLTALWFLTVFLFSCGSGGNDDAGAGAGSDTAIFPPVVFMAANNIDGSIALYASFDDGAEIIELSGTLVIGGDVVDFEISPDGIYVAYVADQDKDGLFELYVVPVDKTPNEPEVKVSVPLEGRGIKETFVGSGEFYFAWAPDSSRVAYIGDADDNTADLFELFTSTPNGRQKNLISALVNSNSDVLDFQWEPESTLIAYVADQDIVGQVDLYVFVTPFI